MLAARCDSDRLATTALLGQFNEVWLRSYPCLNATDGSPDHGLEGLSKKTGVLPGQTRPHRFCMEATASRTLGTTADLLNSLPTRSVSHRTQVSQLADPGHSASASAALPCDHNPPAGRHLTPIQPESLGAPPLEPLPHRLRGPAPGGQPAPRLRGRTLSPAWTDPCPA